MLKYLTGILVLLSLQLFSPAQCTVDLGPDQSLCPGESVTLSVNFQLTGDSLKITYDASQGQTALVGASKVYMHSGGEVNPFGGWEHVVGDWGLDNGLGEMRSAGTDLWEITIHPESYYGLPANTALNGIFMVFRNADGTQTGKDDNGNDIFLDMTQNPPVSAFGGVTADLLEDAVSSIIWSNGAIGDSIVLNTGGLYWVSVTDSSGCVATDTALVSLGALPVVDLGSSPTICNGDPVFLNAGPGFASYAWSDGSLSQTLWISNPGLYTVTVTNQDGCAGSDVIFVDAAQDPVAAFNTTVSSTVAFQNSSTGAGTYAWDFDGDGMVDDTTETPPDWTPPGPGNYNCSLVVTNACGSDTSTQQISIAVGVEDEQGEEMNGTVWMQGNVLQMQFGFQKGGELEWHVTDMWGKTVGMGKENVRPGIWKQGFDMWGNAAGIYVLRMDKGDQKGWFKFLILE